MCAAGSADDFGGPMPVRNYAPIQQLFLNLPFERAVTQAPGTFRLYLESVESNVISTEQGYVEALLKFAALAYRRPLSKLEKDGMLTYYHTLREKNALSHEDAMRNSEFPETSAFAQKIQALCDGPAIFRNLDLVREDAF